MALSVMIYHYTVWSGVALETDSLLRKLGIYAVSVFYILSGLSLAIVYGSRISSRSDVFAFWIRRFFRIGPLYWLAVTAVIAFAALKSLATGVPFEYGIARVLLNYSLMFGFVSPTAYLSTGAWSIGNELVFYSIFPLILLFFRSSQVAILSVLAISVSIGAIFAFSWLDPSRSLISQWPGYINPFNQLFLFWSGVGIGAFCRQMRDDARCARRVGQALSATLVVLVAGFWVYPVDGDAIGLVTGPSRLLLSGMCIAIVLVCYIHPANSRLPDIRAFSFLGEGCYSIYLLHPIIGGALELAMVRVAGLPVWSAFAVSFVATLIASWWTFRFLEKPMMRRGSQLANRISSKA
jgi:peptidoglycan/LPS O-acetylase OafA/YrhL